MVVKIGRRWKNISWLNEITSSTAEAESPERYQYWSAMAAISATIKKNVYLDRHYYKLYPNIYVLLVGKSGLRKGNPILLAKSLVEKANVTRTVVGRGSIQAVIKEIGKAQSVEGKGVIKDASAFLVSGEFDSFLVKDPDALTILTNLYDTNAHEPEWKNVLKSTGVDVLKNPCLTLLGGTNEEHFKSAVAEKDVQGGFIARTIIVLERDRRVINDLMDAPKIKPNIDSLSGYLKELAKVRGVFEMSPDGKELYRAWYDKLCTDKHDDVTGTMERLGDTVLKVAMLISLSHTTELVICLQCVGEAIQKCQECVGGMKLVTMGSGKSPLAHETALVLKDLLKRPEHKVSRKQLLAKYWGEFDSIVLDRVVETLDSAGAITIYRSGKETIYQLKGEAITTYANFQKDIN